MIQAVPDEEIRRRIEADEADRMVKFRGDALVEQRADGDRGRPTRLQERDEVLQGATRVHDVLDEEEVLPLQRCLGIVEQADRPRRDRRIPVARGDEEVDVERALDLTHQIGEEDETPLEEAEHEQLPIGIRGGHVLSEGATAGGDRLRREGDPVDSAALEPRVRRERGHHPSI